MPLLITTSAKEERAGLLDYQEVIDRIIEISSKFKRYGYRRIHIMLGRSGLNINHKRVYHLCKDAGLELKTAL